ncbi:MAG: hypothetical protein ACO1TE_28055 [Prosthecobacter sp.]
MRDKAETYAAGRDLTIIGPLGNGADGSVWEVESKQNALSWALKLHHDTKPYFREKECYERLRGVMCVAGFDLPALLHADDRWLAIEMSIVDRPFILDFAGAYLDKRPDFSEEVWEETLQIWEERYEDDWPLVERALKELRGHGIYYLDVHHQNIALPL